MVVRGGRSTKPLAIMRRIAQTLSMTLLLAFSSASAQIVWTGNALRSSVEGWPEPRRTNVLSFLDQCRRAADSFVQIWLTQDKAAIFASLSPEQTTPRADLERAMGLLAEVFGTIRSTEYRSESVMVTSGDSFDLLLHPYAEADYAITTTKSNGQEYFFQLYLSRAGGMCRVVTWKYQKYWNAVPPWLRRSEPKGGA